MSFVLEVLEKLMFQGLRRLLLRTIYCSPNAFPFLFPSPVSVVGFKVSIRYFFSRSAQMLAEVSHAEETELLHMPILVFWVRWQEALGRIYIQVSAETLLPYSLFTADKDWCCLSLASTQLPRNRFLNPCCAGRQQVRFSVGKRLWRWKTSDLYNRGQALKTCQSRDRHPINVPNSSFLFSRRRVALINLLIGICLTGMYMMGFWTHLVWFFFFNVTSKKILILFLALTL